MRFKLQTATAPRAAAHFTALANSGFYDETLFHSIQ